MLNSALENWEEIIKPDMDEIFLSWEGEMPYLEYGNDYFALTYHEFDDVLNMFNTNAADQDDSSDNDSDAEEDFDEDEDGDGEESDEGNE